MTTTTKLGLDDFVEGQNGAATKLNTNQDILDTLIQLWFADGTPATTPPASGVVNGDAYIVPASATGDWSGQDNNVAVWASGWTFRTPQRGWRAWDEANQRLTIFFGDRWQAFQATRVTELTDNTSGSDTGSLETLPGTTYSIEASIMNDNNATILAMFHRVMDALITPGLMAADPLTEVIDEAVGITEVVDADLNP